jgi:hypothetical protein
LVTIKDKKRKAAAKNVTAAAELKKRKGMAGPKVLSKKLKASTAVIIPAISSVGSSARASASAGEGSANGTGEGHADSVPEVDKPAFSAGARGGRRLEGVELPAPSVANSLPNVMDGDSSSEDAEATGRRTSSPPKEMKAQEMS